mgnify:CR=1 FL=1
MLYAITRYLILGGGDQAYLRARIAFPFIVGLTFGVNTVFWIVKGTKGNPERFGTVGGPRGVASPTGVDGNTHPYTKRSTPRP